MVTLRVKCLSQEHNTMDHSTEGEPTNHEVTVYPAIAIR